MRCAAFACMSGIARQIAGGRHLNAAVRPTAALSHGIAVAVFLLACLTPGIDTFGDANGFGDDSCEHGVISPMLVFGDCR